MVVISIQMDFLDMLTESPFSVPHTEQPAELAQLKATVNYMEGELKEIREMIKEMSGRRFPWFTLIGIIAPIATIFVGFSLQNILQVNLTADRVVQIQKSISDNANLSQRQYDIHTSELEKLRSRIEALERQGSRAKE
jgi:hypothetical protein